MEIKTTPCKECVLIAICRHKRFGQLIHDCSIIAEIWSAGCWDKVMLSTQKILKPTQWGIKETITSSGYDTVERVYETTYKGKY